MASPTGIAHTLENILPASRRWTVAEICAALAARGVKPPQKKIYNALAYLTRQRKITRENYGLYSTGPRPFGKYGTLSTADRDAIREALEEAIAFVEDEREVRGDEDDQYEKPATPLIEKLAALAKRLEVTS